MYKLISWFFHPFSFPLLGILLLFNTNTYINFSYSPGLKLLVYIMVCLNTMILPLVVAWFLVTRGRIASIQMEGIQDRRVIFFITFIFYLLTLFLLSGLNVPGVIYKFAFGGTMTVGVLFVFSLLKKKLSVHMSGIGGLVGALVMLSVRLQTDFMSLITIFILLAGVIGMARIKEGGHRENEIYWGFLLGFFCQVFIFS